MPVFSEKASGRVLRPRHRLAGQVGDAVDEDDPLAGNHPDQVGIGLAEMLVMAFREEAVGIGGRINAADEACNVERIGEGAHRDAVARPVLHRLHAGFEIEAESVLWRQGLEQRGLS